ncbi:MAG: Holliday junction branch migration protein RuvA [Eubacteriales bacterium]|nr:Holliday junction branch migration protein RuvA [Eubacteriales bacterium]
MIAFLSGTLEYLSADTAVVDVGGVGYEVRISAEVSGALSSLGTGAAVKIYTYLYLREDQISLYGFLSRDDLALFRQLITVSGVGPRGGLSLLSVLSADDLRFAIVTGDARMIARAPGVGKKTAERLILDLRDKVASAYAPAGQEGTEQDLLTSAGSTIGGTGAGEASSPASDAIEALIALGYTRAEATRAVRSCGEQEDTEKILRQALRYL